MINSKIAQILRNKIGEQKVKEGEKIKISKDEALTECEYIFKKGLMLGVPLENIFKMIYAYLKYVGYEVSVRELLSYLLRDIGGHL